MIKRGQYVGRFFVLWGEGTFKGEKGGASVEDGAIIELYWQRDQQAITASDQKYGGLCRSLSQNILDSREDAEECVNDTWHRAWITMPPQRPGSLGAYLARITRNLSIDRWRSRRSQKRGAGMEALVLELEDCVPAVPSAEAEFEAREVAAAIDRWLDTLGREDRAAFVRRYWYAERVDELARQFGCTPQQMAGRLFRLRGGLRRALEREGVSL